MNGYSACLAHLEDTDRSEHLATLTPGTEVDYRGICLSKDLLRQLCNALHDPHTGRTRIGNAWFSEVSFESSAGFREATFEGLAAFAGASFKCDADFFGVKFTATAEFSEATFDGAAKFDYATFMSYARFDEATFITDVTFEHAIFNGCAFFNHLTFTTDATFRHAIFKRVTEFQGATFTGDATFSRATFDGDAEFNGVTFEDFSDFNGATLASAANFLAATFASYAEFKGTVFKGGSNFFGATFTSDAAFDCAIFEQDVEFGEAIFKDDAGFYEVIFMSDVGFASSRFEASSWLGPLVCGGTVDLEGAVFGVPVTVDIAAIVLSLQRTRWQSAAALRLRYATVDLTGAVPEFPVTLAAEPKPFIGREGRPLAEEVLAGRPERVRVKSVRRADASLMTLTDVDLSKCRFAGAVHLDRLGLGGHITFARPPEGWHRRGLLPMRWSRRRTLAEEHHWRAAVAGRPASGQQSNAREWRPGPNHPDLRLTPGPETVTAVYRQLRKALEDAKNEPGAADFYYGECEMRRRDSKEATGVERALLTVYWAVSGYGLRASRAMAWLAITMASAVMIMMLWGIPAGSPEEATKGHQVGREIAAVTDTPKLENPKGALADRLSSERFDKALRTVLTSGVFRSSGQNLTTAGTYTEMVSRITEPILIGLAVLAIRGRVKR